MAVLVACDTERSTSPDDDNVVRNLVPVAGDGQIGEAGRALPTPLHVRVIDGSSQHPVAGVRLEWKATGGTFEPASSVTDAAGEATVTHTLGFSAGPQLVTATIAGDTSSRVQFTNTTLVHGAMQMAWNIGEHGDRQRDSVLATLSPYKVIVLDHRNAPVSDVEVRWQVFGRGWLSSDMTKTDANGVAQITHTLGTMKGFEDVLAFVQGLVGSPVRFRSEVTPGAPVQAIRFDGEGQIGLIGGRLDPYRVALSDVHGNAIGDGSDVNVDWKVTSGLGTITPGPPGIATHTLGPVDGDQTVTASIRNAPHVTPLVFTSRAVTDFVGVSVDYYCYDVPIFVPYNATVPSGKTVGWVWPSYCNNMLHNITFEDDSTATLSSVAMAAGRHTRTFTGPPRVIRYRCTLHSRSFTEGMVGTVTIL